MDVVTTQIAQLQDRHPEAHLERAPDGQQLLVVPGVTTGEGFSASEVTLRVLVPTGYPHAHPDCFYTDASLRLVSGAEPANSSVQPVFGGQYRWFSWHLAAWDSGTGSLDQYVRSCERRLRDVK